MAEIAMAGAEMATGRRKKSERDWFALMAPSILAVLVQLGGFLWFMGTMQQRLANVELRVKVVEDANATLDKVYVTRDDWKEQSTLLSEQREDEKRRLDRIEAKVDLILEGHR